MASVAEIMRDLPREVYTNHDRHGTTVHRSLPEAIGRELESLDVRPGDRVLEIGTGSGYTGALLATLTGPRGQVTSVDISAELAARARRIHDERGVQGVCCQVGDGLAGWPDTGPYDRIVAWCTPARLRHELVAQLADGGRLVCCLPIAALPFLSVVATITATAEGPVVEAITSGGYVQSRTIPDDQVLLPHRWADAIIDGPEPSWISVAWRNADTPTVARTLLDQLLAPGHTERYKPAPDWNSWNAFSATLADPALSTADLRGLMRAIGHSTPNSVAMLCVDGTILADTPDSPSLALLRGWLDRWEQAGRPAADQLTPHLVPADDQDGAGWDLRVTW